MGKNKVLIKPHLEGKSITLELLFVVFVGFFYFFKESMIMLKQISKWNCNEM